MSRVADRFEFMKRKLSKPLVQGNGFPTTQWSYISLLRKAEGQDRNDLLGPFLLRYRDAMSDFLRLNMAFIREHDREDYLQGFMADRIIAQDILQHARAERGKLRSYVLTCLVNYIRDQQRTRAFKQQAATESWEGKTVSSGVEPIHVQVFDALWARDVTRQALERFREECTQKQREHVWSIFSRRVLDPIESTDPPPAYSDLAKAMRLSVTQVKNYTVTAKRAYERHLRDVIDEYTMDSEETTMEIKSLRQTLASGIR